MAPNRNRVKGKQPKVYIGGVFNDGGGFVITVDQWGHPHIKRIPPWQPFVENVNAVTTLLEQADRTKNRELRRQLTEVAEQLAGKALQAAGAEMKE